MKSYVSITGGSELACKTIEDVARVGADHLIDVPLTKVTASLSWCKCCWAFLIQLAILVVLIVFSIKYFTDEEE